MQRGWLLDEATPPGDVTSPSQPVVVHAKPSECIRSPAELYLACSYNIPPVFVAKSEGAEEDGVESRAASNEASQIYDDSAVAGYVSLMADDAREMRCYNATGCTKAALVCVLHEATLVDKQPPIR